MLEFVKGISKVFRGKGDCKNSKKIDNRGAAIVSVLIAITFIAIIATSLLYMVYMNYLAKTMRYGSTDNFYTAEFALDDLSSELQQIAVDKGKAGGDITAAITEIRTQVGAGPAAGKSFYDPAKVQALVRAASKDASIVIDTSYPSTVKNYEDSDSWVKLKGVKITSTDEKGFVSTITSDVIIKFSPEGTGDLDICDFSLINDNPIYIGAGDCTLSGYVYAQKHCEGGTPKSYVNGGATVYVLSEKAIFNGDVVLDSSSGNPVMEIYGDVYIMGDLKIDSNSTVVVAGSLKITGSVVGSGKLVEKVPGDSVQQNWTYPGGSICPLYDSSAPDGLVSQLFCDNVLICNVENKSLAYFDFNQYFPSGDTNGNIDKIIGYKGGTPDLRLMINLPDDINANQQLGGADFANVLGLVSNKAVYVRGTCVNSTIVSKYGLGLNANEQTNPAYMQRMDKEQYNWLLNTCVPGIHNTGGLYDSSGHKLSGNAGMKGVAAGTEMPNECPSGFTEKSYTYGSETRKLYYDPSDGTCYLPIKYLLADNTSGIITKLFSSVNSTSDPTTSTATYENWSKN